MPYSNGVRTCPITEIENFLHYDLLDFFFFYSIDINKKPITDLRCDPVGIISQCTRIKPQAPSTGMYRDTRLIMSDELTQIGKSFYVI